MKCLSVLAALLVLSVSTAAKAEGGYYSQTYQVNQPVAAKASVFIVSAVLLKKGTTDGIRLLHGTVENKRDKDEALGAFVSKALQDYPDYSVMSTLVTKLNVSVPAQPAMTMQCV
jgi:hypothetical protein